MVNKSGLNQTIIKSFVDEYKEKVSTIKRIIKENPGALNEDMMKNLLKDTNYLKGLQELKKSNKILEVNREFLNESRGNKLKKRRPYYLDNIEDICYMKSKFPQTTIH